MTTKTKGVDAGPRFRGDPDLVTKETRDVWRTPDGHYYLDEEMAKDNAFTHVRCANCDATIPKYRRGLCAPCFDLYLYWKKESEGLVVTYEDAETDTYFFVEDDQYVDDLEEFVEEMDEIPPYLMVYTCRKDPAPRFDTGLFEDCLPEDCYHIDMGPLEELVDEFNGKVADLLPVTYTPTNVLVDVSELLQEERKRRESDYLSEERIRAAILQELRAAVAK